MKSLKGQCYHIRQAASYEAHEKADSPFLFSLNSTNTIVVPKNNVELLCYRVQIVAYIDSFISLLTTSGSPTGSYISSNLDYLDGSKKYQLDTAMTVGNSAEEYNIGAQQ